MKITKPKQALSRAALMAVALMVASGCGEDSIDGEDAGGVAADAGTRPAMDGGAADSGLAGNADAAPSGGPDAAGTDAAPSGAAFGDECTTGNVCASGTCAVFGMLGQRCTSTCTEDGQCPVGSQGAKCNQQGYCRP